jgi:hypothetical protein
MTANKIFSFPTEIAQENVGIHVCSVGIQSGFKERYSTKEERHGDQELGQAYPDVADDEQRPAPHAATSDFQQLCVDKTGDKDSLTTPSSLDAV